jgi:hypothetical protein
MLQQQRIAETAYHDTDMHLLWLCILYAAVCSTLKQVADLFDTTARLPTTPVEEVEPEFDEGHLYLDVLYDETPTTPDVPASENRHSMRNCVVAVCKVCWLIVKVGVKPFSLWPPCCCACCAVHRYVQCAA